jgi:hypothetical protein
MNASGITLLSCLSASVLAASAVHAQQAPRRIAAGEAYSNVVAPAAKPWRAARGGRACPGVLCVRCA